jgi:hypothetical protein
MDTSPSWSGKINCIGTCAKEIYFYFEAKHPEGELDSWIFEVWPDQASSVEWQRPGGRNQPFYLKLIPFEGRGYRIDMINDNKEKWAEDKGIGPALLLCAREKLQTAIFSSVRDDECSNQMRTPEATKMWIGMVSRDEALFHTAEDRYEVLPNTRRPGPCA